MGPWLGTVTRVDPSGRPYLTLSRLYGLAEVGPLTSCDVPGGWLVGDQALVVAVEGDRAQLVVAARVR